MKIYNIVKVEKRCIRSYRIYSFLYNYSKVLSLLLFNRTKMKYGVDIAPTAVIGKDFNIVHIGGIVIGGDVVIGNKVTIQNGVTLGMKKPSCRAMPCIHDNVFIGTGAKVLGGVTIGNGAFIGASSVVLNDVPEFAIVAGIPARIVGYTN